MHAQSEKARAKRLARWLNRLIQLHQIPLYGYAFVKGIAVPLTHPTQHHLGAHPCTPN